MSSKQKVLPCLNVDRKSCFGFHLRRIFATLQERILTYPKLFRRRENFNLKQLLALPKAQIPSKKKHFSLKRKIAFYGQVFCTDVTKRFWGFQISLDFCSQLERRASYETMRVFVSKGRSSPAQVFYMRVLVKRNNRTHAFFRAYRIMLKSGIFTQTFSKDTNERGERAPRT